MRGPIAGLHTVKFGRQQEDNIDLKWRNDELTLGVVRVPRDMPIHESPLSVDELRDLNARLDRTTRQPWRVFNCACCGARVGTYRQDAIYCVYCADSDAPEPMDEEPEGEPAPELAEVAA